MLPLILSAIQMIQKKKSDNADRQRQLAQGNAYAYPQHSGLSDAASLAGGLLGKNLGGGAGGAEQAGGAMSDVDDAMKSYDAYKGDQDDMFGGMK